MALTSSCLVEGNNCQSNSGNGIHLIGNASRVEANHCGGNGSAGFQVDGSQNLIVKNSAANNSFMNYNIAANNDYGPIYASRRQLYQFQSLGQLRFARCGAYLHGRNSKWQRDRRRLRRRHLPGLRAPGSAARSPRTAVSGVCVGNVCQAGQLHRRRQERERDRRRLRRRHLPGLRRRPGMPGRHGLPVSGVCDRRVCQGDAACADGVKDGRRDRRRLRRRHLPRLRRRPRLPRRHGLHLRRLCDVDRAGVRVRPSASDHRKGRRRNRRRLRRRRLPRLRRRPTMRG